MNIHHFQSMGTHYQFVGISEPIAEEMEHWIYSLEASLSRFSTQSELNCLNQSNGKPVKCSDNLWEIIGLADYYYLETEGIFNPFLGRILCELGYNQSFEKLEHNQQAPISAILPNDHYQHTPILERFPSIANPICLDSKRNEAILHPLVSVDLGGIAKGWSAQKLCSWAKSENVSCGAIDVGGDMVIWGNEDELGWEVLIENPWDPTVDTVYLRVTKEAGIATSSLIKRQWAAGHHHIIDPRTQQSSQSDLVQATVLAPNLTMAEVYTKVLLILGSELGILFVQQKHPEFAYILVKTDGTVIVSPNLNHYSTEWHLTEHILKNEKTDQRS